MPPGSSDAAKDGGGAAWPQEIFLLAAAGAGMGGGEARAVPRPSA